MVQGHLVCIFERASSSLDHLDDNITTRCASFLYWIRRGKNAGDLPAAYNSTIYVNVHTRTLVGRAITANDRPLSPLLNRSSISLVVSNILFLFFHRLRVKIIIIIVIRIVKSESPTTRNVCPQ